MLLEDVRNFQARSRMQLLCQCLPFSKKLGSLHRVKPQWPPPRLGLPLAYRLCLSPILVGQRGALPDEYVPAGQTWVRKWGSVGWLGVAHPNANPDSRSGYGPRVRGYP